jgi:hypothetical protein
MARNRTKSAALALGATAALGAAWVGWGAYIRRTTDQVPYTTALHIDGVEIRRYPDTVVAKTTAGSQEEAFRRLFRYIQGENRSETEIEMTAPVSTEREKIAMTAPVASESSDDGMEMAFFLPGEYTAEGAPEPADEAVIVEHVEARTLAVRPFSWYATEDRIAENRQRLFDTLSAHDLTPTGDPFLLHYDDPWTPPFMRRNEIAVALE